MVEDVRPKLVLIGHNENGLIGFFEGTYELLYLEKPRNWEEVVEAYKLPYIEHEDVQYINVKNYRREDDAAASKEIHNGQVSAE